MAHRNIKKKLQLSDDRLTVEYDRKDFLDSLPHLSNELQTHRSPLHIQLEKPFQQTQIPADPTAVDFLRRCTTEIEALEIIEFLEKRREITPADAQDLRSQLKIQGVNGFGSHKKSGWYEREYR